MDKIAIIRLSSMGDIILTEPVTRSLKDNFPDSEITFITRKGYASLLGMFSAVDRTILLEIPGIHSNLSNLKTCIKSMDTHFDLVLDLHKNIRSRVICRKLQAHKKRSYKKFRLQRQMAVWFKSRKNYIPTTAKYLLPLEKMNLRITETIPELKIDQARRKRAQDFLRKYNFINSKFAILAVGASHPPKKFPLDKYAQIAEMLNAKFGYNILVVDSEEIDIKPFESLMKKNKLLTAVNLDLQTLAGIIWHSKLTVSNDSGIMHLSAALKNPTLGLFGPTHPVLGFEPRGEYSGGLTTDEPCSPCSLHGGRKCHKPEQYCFTNMSLEMIETALKAILR